MNTQPNWKALKQLHNKLAELRPRIKMSDFVTKVENDCATSCCLAGWGMEYKIGTTPYIDELWEQLKQGMNAQGIYSGPRGITHPGKVYAQHILGSERISVTSDPSFEWLFSGLWYDDIDQGLFRLDYFIKHKSVPAFFSLGGYTTKSMSEFLEQFPSVKVHYCDHIGKDPDYVYIHINMSRYQFNHIDETKLVDQSLSSDNYYMIPHDLIPQVFDYFKQYRAEF